MYMRWKKGPRRTITAYILHVETKVKEEREFVRHGGGLELFGDKLEDEKRVMSGVKTWCSSTIKRYCNCLKLR